MKLMLPAVRPAAPDRRQEEVKGQTHQLLEEIDALLAAAEITATTLSAPPQLP